LGRARFVGARCGVVPYERDGWRLGLTRYQELAEGVTLADLRSRESEIRATRDALLDDHGTPLYFPFELGNSRPLRPAQGYLAKLPRDVVQLFPALAEGGQTARRAMAAEIAGSAAAEAMRSEPLGAPYRRALEDLAVSIRDPYEVNPAVVERGLRGHRSTQDALADTAQRSGAAPRSPSPEEPNFDLAWEQDGRIFVAEVKSTTPTNEEKQLRLGLGQVLRYRQLLARRFADREVVGVLAAEREPQDQSWRDLCSRLDVRLVWAANLDELFSPESAEPGRGP
jgi:hypothetical protein